MKRAPDDLRRLGLLALALFAVLAAQLALHYRDRLAHALPALKPVLERLCQPPQCRIGPPRQIDAIAIDSSSFNRMRSDAYRLTVSLTNQSLSPVAMPALELTITDIQDQPVVRRVLEPADFGPGTPAVLGPQSDWTTSLVISLGPAASAYRIAGYRLLAFYP